MTARERALIRWGFVYCPGDVKPPTRMSSVDMAILSEIRGSTYPATEGGLRRALLERVRHIRDARVLTTGPGRAVAIITPRWWCQVLWFMKGRIRRRARWVLAAHAPAQVHIDVLVE